MHIILLDRYILVKHTFKIYYTIYAIEYLKFVW
jgi:hypothetical protein